MAPDALIGDAAHGCRLLATTQFLTASWLSSVGCHSIPYSYMWLRALQSLSLVVAHVRNVVLALAPVSRLSWQLNHVVFVDVSV